MSDPAADTWHFDRRIPLALILTIGIQTMGVAYWMGTLSVRIDQLEMQLANTRTNSDRLTRLEVQLEQANRSLTRIEKAIDD